MRLTVDSAVVRIRDRLILDQLSFSVDPGEFVCLIGPNGAGKTTLLRALAGLVGYAGKIRVDGREISTLPFRQRAASLAYLPQSGPVHWPLTGRDIVAIGRLPYSSSITVLSPEDHDAIETALRLADAEAYADRLVTELSGGERARVLLARALAVESPVLLADEPLSGLDPEHQLGCLAALAELAERDRIVIAAVHDLQLAARFAHRVIVMQQGRIVADGRPEAVLSAELLSQVFAVETIRLEHAGRSIPIPWQRIAPGRDK